MFIPQTHSSSIYNLDLLQGHPKNGKIISYGFPWILDFPLGKYKQSPCKQTQHNCTFFARSTKTLRTLWVNTRAWGISVKNKKTRVLDWRPRVLIFRLITQTNSYFQDGVKYTGFCQENLFTPSDFCGFSFSIHILQPRCPEPSIRSNCNGPGKSCRMDCRCCSSGSLPQDCHWVIPSSDSETDDQSYQSSSFLCSQIFEAQVQGPFQSSLTHGRRLHIRNLCHVGTDLGTTNRIYHTIYPLVF